ncbi:MAG: starch-binding protein [Prevotella sp.]|nr:starch-binding protein [Prevotella sp.]
MKRLIISLTALLSMLPMAAQAVQGWPANYGGVMLQAFSWDDYDSSQWTVLESQADEFAPYFSLVWIPQSGNCFAPDADPSWRSMGYDDYFWFPGGDNYKSSFGTEAQLRSLIKTFKAKGIGTIADVVINHRRSQNGWFGFPTETYNGVTYTMSSKDVCSNDDNGKAKSNNPSATLGEPDTGEDWDGMRDLDHTSTNVQNTVKAYLDMLLNDLGYTGFRYDMVKGYAPTYTQMYNEASKPQFSVGECWDSGPVIENWIDGTGKASAAFDFQFKYVVRNAADKFNYGNLDKDNGEYYGTLNYPLISNKEHDGQYKQWAITFIENHDTQLRPDGSSNGPLNRDTVAFNAYLLAMPGTPCIFLPHWTDYKQDIKSQIMVRQLAGIVNTSNYEVLKSNTYNQVVSTTGNNSKLLTVIGRQERYTPDASWVKILEGKNYSYWLDRSVNTAWISHASGTYETDGDLTVLLSAVTNQDAKLVYTTDGSEPKADSPVKLNSGATISIPNGFTTTLKVGMVVNGAVTNVQTRTYTVKAPYKFSIPEFCKVNDGEICAFFEAPQSWNNTICCWAWDDKNYTGGSWPGVACTMLGVAESGNNVWKWTFDPDKYTGLYAGTMPQYIIFNNSGANKTQDLDFVNGGYYNKDGLVAKVTSGISTVMADRTAAGKVYTLDGRQVNTTVDNLPRGIYVINGRKVIK